MTNFDIEVIKGTADLVKLELQAKFPEVEIVKTGHRKLEILSPESDIDAFRELLSPLAIHIQGSVSRNLYRREWRKESVPAGVNPALAYCLCMLAEIDDEDIVFDPCCGGGTIAITAAKYFAPKKVLASDISGKAVDITLRNFQTAGIPKAKYNVFRSGIAQLKLAPNSVNKVITNLPFGVRVGNHEQNKRLYQDLAHKLGIALAPEGLAVILTQEKLLLGEMFKLPQFKLIHQRTVSQGGLSPDIFVYQKC